jgi:hypothetical protein
MLEFESEVYASDWDAQRPIKLTHHTPSGRIDEA